MVDVFRMAAKAFIENEEGEVLVLKENSDYEEGTNPDKWLIPGGRIEPGEEYGEALRREVKEETGLAVETGEPITMGEWRPTIKGEKFQITAVFFKCKTETKEVKLSKEHTGYKWINPEKHENYNMIGNIHEKFEKYIQKRKNTLAAGKAVIINNKGQILVIKRTADETHLKEMWDVPGGSLEHGEEPEKTVKRETKEEAGIDIEVTETVNTWSYMHKDDTHRFEATYLCKPKNKEIDLGEEHTEHKWANIEEIDELNIYEELKEGIKKAYTKWKTQKELPKLVRDKIPEIIKKSNQAPETRNISEDEAEKWLRKKVLEEAEEFAEDGEVEELADLYAVLQQYLDVENVSKSELERIEENKAEERGSFGDRIILEDVKDE